MNSSKSSPKHENKISFRLITPFELFYQLTYMSAMASSGIARGKVFEIAARSSSPASEYFVAVNTLVDEMRYDYPEACRQIGLQSKSDNMKSFLLRMSDALRSGEPLAEFLAREAEVQGEDYTNEYERNIEALKQWSNAFSSLTISVALIVIIQVISSMISSLNVPMMLGLMGSGVMLSGFGAWIIKRSAPREVITVKPSEGSAEQKQAMRLFRLIVPLGFAGAMVMNLAGIPLGVVLIIASALLLPIGLVSTRSDKKTHKKDEEFSTFMRSVGGTASSSGTTLKQALTQIDLSSFPTLEGDIERLSKRLQALVDPEICWHQFGQETGSKLVSEVVAIFYGAIKIGGDPERVGYLCSLFTSKTSRLRSKRRMTSAMFAGLTTVMQAVIAGLMMFVLSVVLNFAAMVSTLMPTAEGATDGQATINMGMASFTPAELQFLSSLTVTMIILMAVVTALAIILSDGGYKLKMTLYLSMTIFISGVSMLVVPPVVASILTI
ncbi:MAG: type II secretion system F family protein [Anaerolineae bacterium]|nr:type II secretion system F family protein [Anaerolineae bacterium]